MPSRAGTTVSAKTASKLNSTPPVHQPELEPMVIVSSGDRPRMSAAHKPNAIHTSKTRRTRASGLCVISVMTLQRTKALCQAIRKTSYRILVIHWGIQICRAALSRQVRSQQDDRFETRRDMLNGAELRGASGLA